MTTSPIEAEAANIEAEPTDPPSTAMNAPLPSADEVALRRKRAARTAMLVAAVAVAIYGGFILSGVLAQ